jgi:hypothetical protein
MYAPPYSKVQYWVHNLMRFSEGQKNGIAKTQNKKFPAARL